LAIKTHVFPFNGHDILVNQATEPTDIIWENRHIRKTERRFRGLVIFSIMAILAFGTFTGIVWLLKRKLLIMYMKEPPGIDCGLVDKSFGESITDYTRAAYKEELQWQKKDPYSNSFNDLISRQGTLGCFCASNENASKSDDFAYEVRVSNNADPTMNFI